MSENNDYGSAEWLNNSSSPGTSTTGRSLEVLEAYWIPSDTTENTLNCSESIKLNATICENINMHIIAGFLNAIKGSYAENLCKYLTLG